MRVDGHAGKPLVRRRQRQPGGFAHIDPFRNTVAACEICDPD
jgi:hypothetical protein